MTDQELPRVLLVEDDPNDLEMALEALADSHIGNEVVTVRDGEAALDYLFSRGAHARRPPGLPAVVLLDLKLPKVDGIEVLRIIKGEPALRTVPVVVVTSSREDQDLVQSYSLGVNAFVVKPVDFDGFMNAIKQVGLFWAVVNVPPPTFGAAVRK